MPLNLALGVALATAATAAVPTYSTKQLQCRSNFTVNGGGFNLPGDAFFTNGTPALNAGGQASIRISVIGGTNNQGIWLGANAAGSIVYQTPPGGSVSDASINDAGLVLFEQTFTSPDGIFFYDDADASSGLLTDQPIGASNWGSPIVNASGNAGFRASFLGDNAFYAWNGVSATLYAADVDLVASSPYSFLFTPSYNDADQIASKVRVGGPGQIGNDRPDEIRVFNADQSSALIATDDDGDPTSPYSGFDNSVALLNDGRVAFIASLVGGGRGVFLSDGTTTIEIATTADPDLNDIEFFGPAANDDGLVVFRGFDATGFRAVWIGDGTDLAIVVREHDVIATDLGPGRVDQNDNSPVFGGKPSINASGAVAFNCTLTPENDNQIEWGSGVYIATPDLDDCPADLDGNGVVGFSDLTLLLSVYNVPCPKLPEPCVGDVTGDGERGFADLTDLLAAWGPC